MTRIGHLTIARGVTLASFTAIVGWAGDADAQARSVDFSASIRAAYDTNVARGSQALADLRGVRPNDIRYTPSVTVNATTPLGRQTISLRGTLGYEFYQYNETLKREKIDLFAGTSGAIGRCNGGLTGSYARGISDSEDLSLTAQRSIQTTTSVAVNGACPLGSRFFQSVMASHSDSRNSGDVVFVNSTGNSVGTSLNYGSARFGSIGLTAGYGLTDYNQKGPLALPAAPGFKNYSLGVQYSRAIGARLSGRAAVAYTKVEPRGTGVGPTFGSQTGTTWDVGMSYRASSRLQGDIGLSRTIGATNRIGSNYSTTETARVGGSYQISPNLSVNLGGVISKRTYGSALPIPGALLASRETRKTIRGGLSMTVGRHSSLALDAARDQIDTDIEALDYVAERVGLTLTTKF